MPRVVFWSPDTNMTGNTHAIIAVSTLMAVQHKVSCLLMQGNFDSKKIESSFTLFGQNLEYKSMQDAPSSIASFKFLLSCNSFSFSSPTTKLIVKSKPYIAINL